MHSADSPQVQRIMISRQRTLDYKKKLAKEIAGIKD
jgi:4-hydroxybutyryl-CoA dehydratase/vinylacetyl-CoA-Delta-isomerase